MGMKNLMDREMTVGFYLCRERCPFSKALDRGALVAEI